MVVVSVARAVDANWPGDWGRKRLRMAQRMRGRVLLVRGKVQSGLWDVSGHFPREVTAHRNVDSHRGAAFGNCRNVDIAV